MLGRYRIPHVHTRHPNAYRAQEVARAEHRPAHMLAKTVIVRTTDGLAMAVLPANCRVDLQALGTALQEEHLRLATEEEVRHSFPDSEVGAIPPFGLLCGLPVFMDTRLTDEPYIFFNGGTHRDAIHMSCADYVRVTSPRILRFSRDDREAAGTKTAVVS